MSEQSCDNPWEWIRQQIMGLGESAGPKSHYPDLRRKTAELNSLKALLDGIAEAIIATDPAGNITCLNPAAANLTGWTASEAVGRNFCDVFQLVTPTGRQPVESLVSMVQRASHLKHSIADGILIGRDGIEHRVSGTAGAIGDGNGKPSGMVIVFRNISSQLRHEEQIRQAQRMDAIGQLAGGVAHDFNNLLQVIIGFTDLAARDVSNANAVADALNHIRRAADRAQGLTSQLLLFSRRRAAKTQPLDLSETVESMLATLSNVLGQGIDLGFHSCARPVPVMADPQQFELVLRNLCVNARDAMPHGGRIRIEISQVSFDAAYCAAHPTARIGNFACLSIADDGSGMVAEVRDRIFEPFYSTKEVGKGTGLGLAAVYGIVQQHHGFISVYSEPGMGSTFRVYLPLGSVVSDKPVQGRTTAGSASRGRTILFADDDEGVRALGILILSREGYNVIPAVDGQHAIELFEQHAGEIDLALFDVIMPRQSGPAAFQAIRKIRPDLPVLFASGHSFQVLELSGLTESTCEIIHKPFGPTELLNRVQQILARRGGVSNSP